MNSNSSFPDGPDDRLITVVIPTRNRSHMLGQAIASVLVSPLIGAPEQIVVVDDDSGDDTKLVVRGQGVTYIHVTEHNISSTRNAGLKLVRTPYVAFVDDDDVWLPGNMEPQFEALSGSRYAFAYGMAQGANEKLQTLPILFPLPPLIDGIAPNTLHRCYPNLGVILFRRDALEAVGGFDPQVGYHQDGDLLIRIAAHNEIIGIDFVGMLYRMRAPSRARADFFWGNRATAGWRPKKVGVDWRTAIRWNIMTRVAYSRRFCQDATTCASAGAPGDALVCLGRAATIAPWYVAWRVLRLPQWSIQHYRHGKRRGNTPQFKLSTRPVDPSSEDSFVSSRRATASRAAK